MALDGHDELMVVSVAARLLSELHVYRCTSCSLVRLESVRHPPPRHWRCDGSWSLVEQPLTRAVLLRFLSRQMLAGGEPPVRGDG